MYHCHTHFYLISRQPGDFGVFQKMPALERFTHTFFESGELQAELLAQADVIFADLRGQNVAKFLSALLKGKGEKVELILLAERLKLTCFPPT